jgi:hypothetical protein
MDVRYDTSNIRSLYRSGSLMRVEKGISEYKLNLVRVQVIRWDRVGTKPAGEYIFFCLKGNENHDLSAAFFVHKRIMSAVKRIEFVSDRVSYITFYEVAGVILLFYMFVRKYGEVVRRTRTCV